MKAVISTFAALLCGCVATPAAAAGDASRDGAHDLAERRFEDMNESLTSVIRGPGATPWVANALNGVINIITKKAWDTRAGLVAMTGGTHGEGDAARYGGQLGKAQYRAYAKYDEGSDFGYSDSRDAQDSLRMSRAGSRADWQPSEAERLTLQRDLHNGEQFTTGTLPHTSVLPDEQNASGANLVGREHSTRSGRRRWSAQIYVGPFQLPLSLGEGRTGAQQHFVKLDERLLMPANVLNASKRVDPVRSGGRKGMLSIRIQF